MCLTYLVSVLKKFDFFDKTTGDTPPNTKTLITFLILKIQRWDLYHWNQHEKLHQMSRTNFRYNALRNKNVQNKNWKKNIPIPKTNPFSNQIMSLPSHYPHHAHPKTHPPLHLPNFLHPPTQISNSYRIYVSQCQNFGSTNFCSATHNFENLFHSSDAVFHADFNGTSPIPVSQILRKL